jgi:hypothetical protein
VARVDFTTQRREFVEQKGGKGRTKTQVLAYMSTRYRYVRTCRSVPFVMALAHIHASHQKHRGSSIVCAYLQRLAYMYNSIDSDKKKGMLGSIRLRDVHR